MLTIGQLAAYAGTTVRAVRHYHATGLLPEPERDRSGYRSYDARAVVELVRIRTLADAGVPLARVRQLLVADEDEFATAVAEVDQRLAREVRDREQHRERIARLAAGDSLALPPEAVAYLDRLRDVGVPEVVVQGERDAWILVAARLPHAMPTYMALKQQQLEDPAVVALYTGLGEALRWSPEDPRIEGIADLVAASAQGQSAQESQAAWEDQPLDPDLVALLDAMFLQLVPWAARLLELLEERGWTGWTDLRPVEGQPGRTTGPSRRSRRRGSP